MSPRHEGESLSLWQNTESMPTFAPLHSDLEADVCVVGGGIAGLTTAYLLMKEKKSVVLLEDFELASGQSGRTTAQFTTALDERYFDLEKYHGQKGARLAAESHQSAISKVRDIIKLEKINCEAQEVNGYILSEDLKLLEKELSAVRRAGLNDVSLLQNSSLDFAGGCLHFPKQLQLHPIQYLRGLTESLIRGGVKIFTRTRATEFQGGNAAKVKTSHGFEIKCKAIVVATHTPVNDVVAIHTKQAPYRTYVLGFRISKNSTPDGLYWDTLDPYHYIRTEKANGHDILIVGGEDHKTGQESSPDECYAKLEKWTRDHFPNAQDLLYRWSGQVMEPTDGLAFLGSNPLDEKNVYVITGDSGNGMTHSTIGAMLITDLILERTNPWKDLYDPSRISMRAATEFIKENVNVAAQYADWVLPTQEPDFNSLHTDSGVVYRNGMTLTAVYKDDLGNLDYLSPVCPHLGGIVRWNSAEKSWDCPCHGSRFDCHGKVVDGPATQNLKKLDIPAMTDAIPVEVPHEILSQTPAL